MSDGLKVIYAARNSPEAHMLKNHLGEAGIRAIVTNDVLEGGAGVDIVGWPTLPRVVVAAEDAEAARRMALEFDRSASTRAGDRDLAIEEEPGEEAPELDPWPRCPGCGAPRMARCPFCGTANTQFRFAEYPGQEESRAEGLSPLVICPTCDEAFRSPYLKECEWCGHQFADGIPPPKGTWTTELTWRVVIVAIAVVAIVAGLIAYFESLV